MAFEFDQSESAENTGGGNRVSKEGTYHVLTTIIDENPATREGRPLDGLKVSAEVLDGTEKDQKGKEIELMFFRGKPSDKDGGEFARKKLTRFFLAIGLLQEHAPGKRATIDTQDGVGRQFIVRMKKRTDEGTKKTYTDVDGAAIFHVDDEEVKDIPKASDALSLIDASLRKSDAPVAKAGSGVSLDDI